MSRNRSNALPALAAATILIGASLLEPLADGTTTEIAIGLSAPAPEAGELYKAITACRLDEAQEFLTQAASARNGDGTGVPTDSLILGLAAARCKNFSKSLELLRSEPAEGTYGDWRLLALAQSAIELGQYSIATDALDRLRTGYASSPLFERATLSASELAESRGDLVMVAEIARQGRLWQLGDGTSEALEAAAWRAGNELDDPDIRHDAAIELLARHPLRASKLEVIEVFRAEDGSLDWPAFLSPAQLLQRAESLLGATLWEPAMTTLAEVPETKRDWRWYRVSAEALTKAGKGEEALLLLDAMQPRSREQEREHAWGQALAALEVSAPKSGRHLSSVQRRMMRDRAHEHLEAAVALELDRDRARRAYRILFEDALEDEQFEKALENLRRLKALDPEDTTGAGQLWRLGWKQHTDHNYSGAIGYWTELSSLYPRSVYNRSGLYWTALAHEALGNRTRARQLLAEVADVPVTDFYRRHALRRLGGEPAATDAPTEPTEPWPRDPALTRAELLLSMGLHEAALTEIEGLARHVDSRSARALKAIALADAGERRNSIIEIKSVYPLLGTTFQGMVPERARLLYYPLAFDDIIARHSSQNGLDRNLVLAMIRQESAFDPVAKSWAGARGLMQVMPATGREIARRLGLRYTNEQSNDPAFSIQLGTTYYKQVRSMFDNDDELSLAGYNAGPYRIKRLWRQAGTDAELDRFLETLGLEETKSYVKRVLLFADSYERHYPDAG